jgi:hypothetical protein
MDELSPFRSGATIHDWIHETPIDLLNRIIGIKGYTALLLLEK